MYETVMNDNLINAVKTESTYLVRDLMQEDLVEMVLYGSCARGDYTEDSDIDIVALVHGCREDLQARLKRVWDISAEIGLEHDVIVSPTVIPYDEFMKYKQSLPYYRNSAEEGRKIG